MGKKWMISLILILVIALEVCVWEVIETNAIGKLTCEGDLHRGSELYHYKEIGSDGFVHCRIGNHTEDQEAQDLLDWRKEEIRRTGR